MIIESGIDVVQVLCGSVSNDNPQGLWIIAMDQNLRLLYIEPIVPPLGGGLDAALDQHVEAVETFLYDQRDVEYFALAWSTAVVREHESGWLKRLDDKVKEALSLGARRLLGQIVFDPHTMFASIPSCDFSLEPQLSDLPRAMAIAGPHGLDCGCPPCRADRREFDESFEDSGAYGDEYLYSDDLYAGRGPRDEGPFEGGPHLARGRVRHRPARGVGPHDGLPLDLSPSDEPQFDPIWKRWYPEPERAYRRWTFDEEVTIAQSHFAGLSCFDISILVQRQPSAVASRLNKLGISSRIVETTPQPPVPLEELENLARTLETPLGDAEPPRANSAGPESPGPNAPPPDR